MRQRIVSPSVRLLLLLQLLVVVVAVPPGCGQAGYYPDAQVKTLVGEAGECACCGKEIDEVSEDNLATIQGIQYVVCDEKCAKKQEEWVRTH